MRGWWAVAVAALAAGQACGGGATDGVRLENLSQRQYDVDCEFAVRCGYVSSSEGCASVVNRLDAAEMAQIASDMRAGLLKYDGRAAAECLAAKSDAATYGSCLYTVANPLGLHEACRRMLTGTVAGGGACTSWWQCASGQCTQACHPAECCAGTCFEPLVLPLGGDCTISDGRFCGPGTGCLGGVCVATPGKGKLGDTCIDPDDCEVGGVCSGRTCETLPAAGAPCNNLCDQMSYYCDTGSPRTCVRRRLVGQSCDAQSNCTLDAYCDEAAGTCVRTKNDGAACSTGIECRWNSSTCDDATKTCKPHEPPLPTCAAP